jgi:hypothetical protein
MTSTPVARVSARGVSRLSTGRHFLAFTAEPVSAVLLSARSAMVLSLISSHQPDLAPALGDFLAARPGSDPGSAAEDFRRTVLQLCAAGLVHLEEASC